MTVPQKPYQAFRIVNDGDGIHGSVVDATLDDLPEGEVLIEAQYSSVNYKDALAATGASPILRRFPLVGGIDVAGTVAASRDARVREGEAVIVTGYDLGVARDGGYARYVRVPADWVVPRPAGLTPFEAMALGTAGFTAGLALLRLEQHGLTAGRGTVVVTGSTGGVGSVAIATLSRLGYEVTAITGKDEAHEELRALGAATVVSRHTLALDPRPLGKAMWAAGIDAVGGPLLAWLVRTTHYGGAVACTGLTGGTELPLTVLPFILRGVSLLGIDSVACPMPLRRQVWERLAGDMKPRDLGSLARAIPMAGLPEAFATLLAGKARGRFVVTLSPR